MGLSQAPALPPEGSIGWRCRHTCCWARSEPKRVQAPPPAGTGHIVMTHDASSQATGVQEGSGRSEPRFLVHIKRSTLANVRGLAGFPAYQLLQAVTGNS